MNLDSEHGPKSYDLKAKFVAHNATEGQRKLLQRWGLLRNMLLTTYPYRGIMLSFLSLSYSRALHKRVSGCYGLNESLPQKVMCLITWFPAGDTMV